MSKIHVDGLKSGKMKKRIKRGLSIALSAALVVSSLTFSPAKRVKANEVLTPIIDLTFDGTTADTTYTEDEKAYTLVGGASVVEDADNSSDKVLAVTPDSY